MAEYSGFFDSQNIGTDTAPIWDRSYLAEAFASYFALFIGNGVFPNPPDQLSVIEDNGFNVLLTTGAAFINGYWYKNTEAVQKAIAPPAVGLNRIDRIILRWSSVDRQITSQILQGVPALSPVVPLLTRNADTYEISLCRIYVYSTTTAITQELIFDERLDNSVCGLVTGVVDQIDTETLFAQVEAMIQHLQDVIAGVEDGSEFMLHTVYDSDNYVASAGGIRNVIPNPNLLNNSWFYNLVNQRGADSYNNIGTTNTGYTIDRWLMATGSFNTSTRTLVLQPSANVASYWMQYIIPQAYEIKVGDQITASAKIDGNVYVITGVVPDYPSSGSTMFAEQILPNGTSFRLSTHANRYVSVRLFRTNGTTSGAHILDWFKLEKGPIATPYVVPKYSDELEECQRYFKVGTSITMYSAVSPKTTGAISTQMPANGMISKPSGNVFTYGGVYNTVSRVDGYNSVVQTNAPATVGVDTIWGVAYISVTSPSGSNATHIVFSYELDANLY